MNFYSFFIIFAITKAINAGSPILCASPSNDFLMFEDNWIKYVDYIENFPNGNQKCYHIPAYNMNLRPYLLSEIVESYPIVYYSMTMKLRCDADQTIVFAANVSSRLTAVDSEIAYKILSGAMVPPIEPQPGCVEYDLLFMRKRYLKIIQDVIPALKNANPKIQITYSSCSEALEGLATYSKLVEVIPPKAKQQFIFAKNLFESLNMADLLSDSFLSYDDCKWRAITSDLSSLLNSNPEPLYEYLADKTTTLSYPYDCIKDLLDGLKSYLSQKTSDIFKKK